MSSECWTFVLDFVFFSYALINAGDHLTLKLFLSSECFAGNEGCQDGCFLNRINRMINNSAFNMYSLPCKVKVGFKRQLPTKTLIEQWLVWKM